MGMSKKRIKPPIKVRDMAAVSLRHFKSKVVPDAKKKASKEECRSYRD
jgi:hypothetical protein